MAARSAGLLMFRIRGGIVEVLLVHPGGPFWAEKDAGVWSIPKGEFEAGEVPLDAAKREFREETGFEPKGEFLPLEEIRQKSGKIVQAWAFAGDADPAALVSNTFSLEWPPRSGRTETFPEVDRAAWFRLDEAAGKINPAQARWLARIAAIAAAAR
jgi:predicted NUDIX family NTP pyrophosphohydrolase